MVSWTPSRLRSVLRLRYVATGGFQCDSGRSDGAQDLPEYLPSTNSSLPVPPRPTRTILMRSKSSTKPVGFCHGVTRPPSGLLLLPFQDRDRQYPWLCVERQKAELCLAQLRVAGPQREERGLLCGACQLLIPEQLPRTGGEVTCYLAS